MSAHTPDRDRARGMLLAAAAGDALGWPQEERSGLAGGARARAARKPVPAYTPWIRVNGSRFARYSEPIDPGAYSDDTQLVLAVARANLTDDWYTRFTQVELPAWPFYQRGGGRAVLSAANTWAAGRAPWDERDTDRTDRYFRAGANGVAMRVSPHVLWRHGANAHPSAVAERVIRDGVSTHGHPRALIGALTYAAILDAALTATEPLDPTTLISAAQESLLDPEAVIPLIPSSWFHLQPQTGFIQAWHRTNQEMRHSLEVIETSLRRGSLSRVTETLAALGALGEQNGSGITTTAGALYLSLRAGSRPIDGLLQAAYAIGADTDTLAALTGGILGAIHGTGWLENLADVQDAPYITVLADMLLDGEAGYPAGSLRPAKTLTKELEELRDREGTFADGRPYRLMSAHLLNEQPWVTRFELRLADGQTVYTNRLHRTPPRHAPTLPLHPALTRTQTTEQATTNTVAPGAAASRSRPANGTGTALLRSVIVLPVTDLDAVTAFYSRLTGADLRRDDTTLYLTDTLAFQQSAHADPAPVEITLTVADVTHTSERLHVPPSADGRITLPDPAGNTVTIVTAG